MSPHMNPHIRPSAYKPTSVTGFVGDARRIAEFILAKIQRMDAAKDFTPIKLLLHGPPGTGKTVLAGFLGLQLAKHPLAIDRLNGQSCSVERVRDWQRCSGLRPMFGDRIVRIVDEVDAASEAAHNQLRTYLDDLTTGHCFIATTNVEPARLQPQLQRRLSIHRVGATPPETLGQWVHGLWPTIPAAEAQAIAAGNDGCVAATLIDVETWLDAQAMATPVAA